MERASTKASATIDEYLARVSPRFRSQLRGLRRTIRQAAPRATESISYGIPTFKQDDAPLIYFSAAKNHVAIHMVRKALLTRIVKARLAEIRSKTKRR